MATLSGEAQVQIIQNGGGNWQIEVFTIAQTPANQYTLSNAPQFDDDNDPLLVVKLNGVTATRGTDYTLNGTVITWLGVISLEQGDILETLYQTA